MKFLTNITIGVATFIGITVVIFFVLIFSGLEDLYHIGENTRNGK